MGDMEEMVFEPELYEAVELSKPVFSKGREVFEGSYDGDVEAYMLVQDIRNRIEVGTMDSGEMVYPEDLPDLDELGGEEAAEIFYSLGSEDYDIDDVPEEFFDEGLVREEEDEVFYGENAFPYLLILDEAERIVEPKVFEAEVVEPEDTGEEEYFEAEVIEEDEEVSRTDNEEEVPEEVSSEEKVDELSEIWDNVTGSEE